MKIDWTKGYPELNFRKIIFWKPFLNCISFNKSYPDEKDIYLCYPQATPGFPKKMSAHSVQPFGQLKLT